MKHPDETHKISSQSGHPITVKLFGLVDYLDAYNAMSEWAGSRSAEDMDEIWLLQHPPVYTQGTSCTQSTLFSSDIPLVKTDRGGQITYHGPGQLVMYPLLNLRRYGLGVKSLVTSLEQSVMDVLCDYSIGSQRREDAPGVYVDQAKIAALGLRIRRGNSYHGLSLNVDMDLTPFSNIDPCGFAGLRVTQMCDLCDQPSIEIVQQQLLDRFVAGI